MGHEISGEIAEIGENISGLSIGDKIVAMNVALDVGKGELRGLGIFENGGFAEYVKVRRTSVFSIPQGTSIKDAAMIESFANITRAIKTSRIKENEKILIMGGGNIGLAFLDTIISERNPQYVIVIEPHEFLREKAIELGATDSLPPSKAKIRKILKSSGPPSFIFDTVGSENTILMGIDLIQKGGTILIEGIQKGTISLPTFQIINKEVFIKGCLGHDKEDILAAIDLFAKNKVHPDRFISKVISLKDIQNTFQLFLEPGERKFIKILVKM